MPRVYWVDGIPGARVAVLERPRGGEDLPLEAMDLKEAGVDIVVSLLEPAEARELSLEGEGRALEAEEIKFVSFPIPDGGAPESTDAARALVATLVGELKRGKGIGFHCRAGIGRSPTIAAATLMAAGVRLDVALAAISLARGWRVPETYEQLQWLQRFADLAT